MKPTIIAGSFAILLVASASPQTADEPSVQLRGHVLPGAEVELKTEVAGRIKVLRVAPGDQVKTGDLLAEIDEADTLSTIEVRAPSPGTVLSVRVIQRQFVRPASDVERGTTLMTIANLSKLMVEAHIQQDDVAKLALKQSLRVTALAFPEERMDAAITFIAPIVTVRDSVKGFTVQAVIAKPYSELRPGAAVQLTGPAIPTSK